MNILDQIHLQNPWYRNRAFRPAEEKLPKRNAFDDLWADITNLRQIISISGLRRVGKSTLIKQIINSLLENKTDPYKILYFSFDQPTILEEKDTLEKIITLYLKEILNKDIYKIKQKVYIFLDEIQLIPFWQDIVKRYYDISPNLKFIVSGSASLLISSKSKESLAGRIFEKKLSPLTFSEYKKLSKNRDFEEFLNFGQFPELLDINDNLKKIEYLKEGVISKVLEVDIVKTYGVRKISDFERLFWSLLPNCGQIIDSSRLMSDLGFKKATLFKYLKVLEQSLLINKVLNFSGSFRSEKRLLRKLYPGSSNFLSVISDPVNSGFKAETYVSSLLSSLNGSFYLYKIRDKEIDFILPERKTVIEVKYHEKIHKSDFQNKKSYNKKKKYRGIMVTKNKEQEFQDEDFTLIPIEEFEQKLTTI